MPGSEAIYISYLAREAKDQAKGLRKALQGMSMSCFLPETAEEQAQAREKLENCILPVILATKCFGEITEDGQSASLDEAMTIKRRWRNSRQFVLIRMCDEFQNFETRQHLPLSQFGDAEWKGTLSTPPTEVVMAILEKFEAEEKKGQWVEAKEEASDDGDAEPVGSWLIDDKEGRIFWEKVFEHNSEGGSTTLQRAISGSFDLSDNESSSLVEDRILNTPPDTPPRSTVSVQAFAQFCASGLLQAIESFRKELVIKANEERERQREMYKKMIEENGVATEARVRAQAMETLLNKGLLQWPEKVFDKNQFGWTILDSRTAAGDEDSVAQLLLIDTEKKLLRSRTDDGSTVLHKAVIKEKVEVLRRLCNADDTQEILYATNNNGYNCFQLATSHGHPKSAKLLAEVGGKKLLELRDQGGYTVFHRAAMNGHAGVLKVLSEVASWDLISARDEEGCTCLHWAARGGKDEAARFLLELRDEILLYTLDQKGRTPLHMAAQWGKPTTMQVLSQAADLELIYAEDDGGNTCVDLAAKGFGNTNVMVTKVLLERLMGMYAGNLLGTALKKWKRWHFYHREIV